jgi:hypothetical protein
MRRPLCALITIALMSSCSPGGVSQMPHNVAMAAQEKLQRTLANQFMRKLGDGVDRVVGGLSAAGGYLDNPLVQILLPPPMGVVLAVARDLHADPKATALEHLMNHAAEAAIPGAGPILRAAVRGITPADAQTLLQGGTTAASDYLVERTRGALLEALSPVIAENLAKSGAQEVYESALKAYELQKRVALTSEEVLRASVPEAIAAEIAVPQPRHPLETVAEVLLPPALPDVVTEAGRIPGAEAAAMILAHEPPQDLGEYVTGKAIDGLFSALGQHERLIRRELQAMAGGLVPSN